MVDLYKTPNKVNKNGCNFIGKLFVFEDANANQMVVSESKTTSVVEYVVRITISISTMSQ